MRRVAARLLIEAYARDALGARPGLILFVQTFGDLAKFNPHVHVLAADGATYLNAGIAGVRYNLKQRLSALSLAIDL